MTKLIVNLTTTEIIERELNTEELAQQSIDEANLSIKESEAEAKAVARQAILDRLGLTEQEARLLLG